MIQRFDKYFLEKITKKKIREETERKEKRTRSRRRKNVKLHTTVSFYSIVHLRKH